MPIIKNIYNQKKKIKCLSCELSKSKDEKEKPIYETKYFELRQDYELPIPAFFIISSKRHITGFADFNDNEQKDFIKVLHKTRKIMRDKLKIKFIHIFMREETIQSKKSPSHFHIGLLPKYKWMNKFENDIEIFRYAKNNMKDKKTIKQIENISNKMKKYMKK